MTPEALDLNIFKQCTYTQRDARHDVLTRAKLSGDVWGWSCGRCGRTWVSQSAGTFVKMEDLTR